jgi:hypothetical protein
MEQIIFRELMIYDDNEKVAQKIAFSRHKNLLTSERNSRGKSVIMKSLYHCMGANSSFDDKFVYKQRTFVLDIEYKEIEYKICRRKDKFIVLKNNELILNVPSSKISILSKFYEKEFNFSVYLKNRYKDLKIAPPAYSFSPYYLDQDKSWKQSSEPFENEFQFEKASRKELYYYHLSILDNKYNKAKSNSIDIERNIKETEKQLEVIDNVLSELRETLEAKDIAIDEEETASLVREIHSAIDFKLKVNQDIKNELYSIENLIVTLDIQKNELKSVIRNLRKENKDFLDKTIDCPYCNSIIDLNEMNRIRNDYNIEYLNNSIKQIEIEMNSNNERLTELQQKLAKSNQEIDTVYEEVTKTNELLTSYLNRKACSILFDKRLVQLSEIKSNIFKLNSDNEENLTVIKEYNHAKKVANKLFKTFYHDNLFKLQITNVESGSIKPFEKVKLSGSQYVRSTLAFFLSFQDVKDNLKSTKFDFPLVIDSPREGEQDKFSSQDIINTIFSKTKSNAQVIVATIDGEKYIEEIEEEINVIKLTNEKGKLLSDESYKSYIDEINKISGYLNSVK